MRIQSPPAVARPDTRQTWQAGNQFRSLNIKVLCGRKAGKSGANPHNDGGRLWNNAQLTDRNPLLGYDVVILSVLLGQFAEHRLGRGLDARSPEVRPLGWRGGGTGGGPGVEGNLQGGGGRSVNLEHLDRRIHRTTVDEDLEDARRQ